MRKSAEACGCRSASWQRPQEPTKQPNYEHGSYKWNHLYSAGGDKTNSRTARHAPFRKAVVIDETIRMARQTAFSCRVRRLVAGAYRKSSSFGSARSGPPDDSGPGRRRPSIGCDSVESIFPKFPSRSCGRSFQERRKLARPLYSDGRLGQNRQTAVVKEVS